MSFLSLRLARKNKGMSLKDPILERLLDLYWLEPQLKRLIICLKGQNNQPKKNKKKQQWILQKTVYLALWLRPPTKTNFIFCWKQTLCCPFPCVWREDMKKIRKTFTTRLRFSHLLSGSQRRDPSETCRLCCGPCARTACQSSAAAPPARAPSRLSHCQERVGGAGAAYMAGRQRCDRGTELGEARAINNGFKCEPGQIDK